MFEINSPLNNSWIPVAVDSDFPIQNIPFGVFKTQRSEPRCCTRIGDTIIDLAALAENGYFDDIEMDSSVFYSSTLNDFMSCGKSVTSKVREQIALLFNSQNPEFPNQQKSEILYPADEVLMLMPITVGDYTDFYSSIEHATNVGKMFRDPENALLPNWKHLPVGYHGRSSSIVVSGTDIHRPKGQILPAGVENPIFSPSRLMDFELEMAFITNRSTELGDSIPVENAEEYIFGFTLFNDLSARDIQKWEYVPLGPFLGKNFGSVISPWIITLEALEPFRVEGPVQVPEVLPYLKTTGKRNFDINLEVYLQPEDSSPSLICQSNHKYLYWNIAQQLAHQTINGCNINSGDMYASGTISGPTENSFGSMLELSWGGKKDIHLADGQTRKFIQDNDTIIMKAYAQNGSVRIGFGDVITKILPAK
ncbi:MAG: fumarylacetoacetase [Bacteroidales bacterium]|nr:fumarylacetoacetase [Bacteroidales bacterium]